jgi:hypothetical protein
MHFPFHDEIEIVSLPWEKNQEVSEILKYSSIACISYFEFFKLEIVVYINEIFCNQFLFHTRMLNCFKA